MAATQGVQLWDYWFILRKRKLMILATLIVVLFIVTLVNILQKPIYSACCDLLLGINQPTRIISAQTSQEYSAIDSVFFDTQAKLMKSSYFASLVAEELFKNRLELPENWRGASKESLAGLANAIISLPSMTSARVIRITVENYDPKLAAYLANAIARVYISYLKKSQIESSQHTLIVLMQKLEDLSQDAKIYGENHPLMIALKQKKKELEEKLITKADAQPFTQEQPANSASTASGLTAENKDKANFSFSPQVNEALYKVLLQKLQEIDLTRDALAFNVRVIEPARVPGRPVRPNKRLNTIIGLVMGAVMGTGLAFFREYLDTTIKTVEDIKNYFSLPVLGLIPSMEPVKPKNTFEILRSRLFNKEKKVIKTEKNELQDELAFQVHRLASVEQLKAPVAEAYRTLRTNLQFIQVDKPTKTLLITSAIRGEGKTTTSVNLGIILAQIGKKTLVVDTDLRRPRIHRAFNKSREVGLTNLLLGESCLEDMVIPTDIANLTILPSGPLPPNPAELISSERMKHLIKYMESKYDIVLFDSPPLVAVTDAAILATEVDGLLLVVEASALPRELLKQGLERLNNVNANILGSVLNNVNLQKGSYYYYYYHYYHYDYAYADKT